MNRKISKAQRRAIVEKHGLKHTDACRAHNPRGERRHFNGCPEALYPERLTMFGGYHCVCDFTNRLLALAVETT